MPKIMCQRPSCVEYASNELTAEGTSHGFQVCYADMGWAKRQLAEDFPGRRVERNAVEDSTVIHIGDSDVLADDPDEW